MQIVLDARVPVPRIRNFVLEVAQNVRVAFPVLSVLAERIALHPRA